MLRGVDVGRRQPRAPDPLRPRGRFEDYRDDRLRVAAWEGWCSLTKHLSYTPGARRRRPPGRPPRARHRDRVRQRDPRPRTVYARPTQRAAARRPPREVVAHGTAAEGMKFAGRDPVVYTLAGRADSFARFDTVFCEVAAAEIAHPADRQDGVSGTSRSWFLVLGGTGTTDIETRLDHAHEGVSARCFGRGRCPYSAGRDPVLDRVTGEAPCLGNALP